MTRIAGGMAVLRAIPAALRQVPRTNQSRTPRGVYEQRVVVKSYTSRSWARAVPRAATIADLDEKEIQLTVGQRGGRRPPGTAQAAVPQGDPSQPGVDRRRSAIRLGCKAIS